MWRGALVSAEIMEARGEGWATLSIDKSAVDFYDDMPGQAVVYTWIESGAGDILNVEELRNLRRLIDETLGRLS